jgi:hypothetical protein
LAKTAALSLAKATGASLSEARRAIEAAQARAAAKDRDQRRTNVRAARSLRVWTDPYGTWQLHARGLPEDGAQSQVTVA